MSRIKPPHCFTPECNRVLMDLLVDLWGQPRREAARRVMHELAHGSAILYVMLKFGERYDTRDTRAEQLEVIRPGRAPDMPSIMTWTSIELFPGLKNEYPHLGRVPTPDLLHFCDELGITNVVLDLEYGRVIYLRRGHVKEPLRIHRAQFSSFDDQPAKPLTAMTRQGRLARLKKP
jgi:hypothetical protein